MEAAWCGFTLSAEGRNEEMREKWYKIDVFRMDGQIKDFAYYIQSTSKKVARETLVEIIKDYPVFYGYLNGDIGRPYWAKPYGGHKITVEPYIVPDDMVPNEFREQKLF
jgi:hypothetical protein